MPTDSPVILPDRTVAILGAGPAGIVSARWLKHCGFEPVLFEASGQLGGQWNSSSPMSGTWSGMRTNTSRILSAFSDFPHPPGTAVYPDREQMRSYLQHYAAQFEITPRIRIDTHVELLDRHDGGWLVRSRCRGVQRTEVFRRVLVATGRHGAADVPRIPGMDSYAGSLGVAHTSQYSGVDRYRGKDVVVMGCSISALEISAELALGGARSVTTAYRRARYVLPKMTAGVPTDHVMFTRAAALGAETAAPDMLARGLKALIMQVAGNPAQYGALAPDDNVFVAGITQSQHFLTAVAEGRISTRPNIVRVENDTVHFTDGTSQRADALLLGTGYRLSLPWLAPSLAPVLAVDDHHIDLHDHTFHPELPGLAFVGLYDQIGPLLPVLELQARWVAYTFGGVRPAPTRAEMLDGVARSRAARGGPKGVLMNAMALLFARRAGVEPDPASWPQLQHALLFGPLSPISFRLQGPDRLPGAATRVAAEAVVFGALGPADVTAEEARRPRVIPRASCVVP